MNTSISPMLKIVGGSATSANAYPYLVNLRSTSSDHIFCGGTILSTMFILTAAHCLKSTTTSGIKVVAGDHYVRQVDSTEQKRNVRRMIIHENYNSNTHENDVALLELDEPLTFSSSVTKIKVRENTGEYTGACTIVGWGTLHEGGYSPSVLHEVVVPLVSNSECGNSYGQGKITSKMMCAGAEGKDTCQGDSGGPMICSLNGVNEVSGVTSFGHGCGRTGFPGVYADVSEFVAWIKNRIENNGGGSGSQSQISQTYSTSSSGGTATVKLYEHPNYQGGSLIVTFSPSTCMSLPESWKDRASSIETPNTCVRVWRLSECKESDDYPGVNIGPGTSNQGNLRQLSSIKLDDDIRSLSHCQSSNSNNKLQLQHP